MKLTKMKRHNEMLDKCLLLICAKLNDKNSYTNLLIQ